MNMKSRSTAVMAGILLLPVMVDAFPPAPHHTFFGMVRDELGRPLEGEKVEVLFETSTGRLVRTGVGPAPRPGSTTGSGCRWTPAPRPTSTTRWPCVMAMPYKIRVRVGRRGLSADRDGGRPGQDGSTG